MTKIVKSSNSQKNIPAKHNQYIDVLKGLAIVLVVLGHSIQDFAISGGFDNNLIFRVIYSFHMPLFMFLSGAAAAYSSRPMNFVFIKNKFYMLVIPFIAWYCVGYYLGGAYHLMNFGSYMYNLALSPDNGLWFLWVLFLNFCCLAVIKRMEKYIGLYGYILVWFMIFAIPTGHFGIGLVKWQLPFFLVGYLVFRYRKDIAKFRKLILALCVISFPLMVASWHRVDLPNHLMALEPRLLAHNLQVIQLGGVMTVSPYPIIVLLYKYAVGFAGIGFVYWLFKIKPAKYLYGLLSFLGLYTMDIYVAHVYFFRFAFGQSVWMKIISGFFIALIMSLLLGIFVLRKVDILNKIFLGGRTIKKQLSK